jgi:uncharacterized protein with von Willebrand factor type A (vWA) domain
VSLAEFAEAFSAVDLMGIQDREQFRLSLRATLIKNVKNIPTFDKVLRFSLGRDSRIACEFDLYREVIAWETSRNDQKATIHWTFTRQKARKKFGAHPSYS